MSIKRRDRVLLPNEAHSVLVRGVDYDEDEVTLFFERADGSSGEIVLVAEEFTKLAPIRYTGEGNPRLALAGLWGYWIRGAIAGIRQAALATTSLRAYAHQDEAVYGAMLRQPTLRFLLADEPGTGKTIMCGMYVTEMLRQARLKRVLFVVPAHLLPKWERDLQRFFGIQVERLTPEVAKSIAPLHPDIDFWLVSADLLSRNQQVQRKAIFSMEGAWDLVVFDEAHRLTPTAQAAYPVAQALSQRATHLLILTATPHRGNEYLFRALLHLLDPELYPWRKEDAPLYRPNTPRLRPARTHFLRRMKEQLRDRDNITPLFPKRRAHNVPVPLSPIEQQLYEAVLSYCETFVDDTTGLALSIYGKRGASSFYALSETLQRRAQHLKRGQVGPLSGAGVWLPRTREEVLESYEDEQSQNNLELGIVATASKNTEQELVTNNDLRARIASLLNDADFLPAKWQAMMQRVLPQHGITPGGTVQLLVFTEYADTATWLEKQFKRLHFRVRRYTGELRSEEREQIQAAFLDKQFEILISTDAGNEGIDLQSAHVLVNWDIPWSIVRLEQRAGRLHRIGQRSQVDIYNLIATTTREGRVQEVILNNIVAAANALEGKIFDFLGAVVEQLGVDYGRLLLQAGAGGASTEAAVQEAQQVTVSQYTDAAQAQRQLEERLATPTDTNAFFEHLMRDRLDAVNPAVVAAFMRVLSEAKDWRMTEWLHDYIYRIETQPAARTVEKAPGDKRATGDGLKSKPQRARSRKVSRALGGGEWAIVVVSTETLAQARREGADLSEAILLGPAEPAYRTLVEEAIGDAADEFAKGVVLVDPSALTPYELFVFDTALVRTQAGRAIPTPRPLLIRWDRSGARTLAWQSVSHLSADAPPTAPSMNGVTELPSREGSHAISATSTSTQPLFLSGPQAEAEALAQSEMEQLKGRVQQDLRKWAEGVAAQLDKLQDDVVEPYSSLPHQERKARYAAVAKAVTERKKQLENSTGVSIQPPRLVGRVQVLAGAPLGGEQAGGDGVLAADSFSPRDTVPVDSEMHAMRLCKELLEADGFTVEDVHQSGCGYDLHARRGYEQRCVEVKGLQGSISPGIMLEASEWLMAQQYGDEYWLYVVVDCSIVPRLFAAYRNPVAAFGEDRQLVQRFHIPASTLRKVLAQ